MVDMNHIIKQRWQLVQFNVSFPTNPLNLRNVVVTKEKKVTKVTPDQQDPKVLQVKEDPLEQQDPEDLEDPKDKGVKETWLAQSGSTLVGKSAILNKYSLIPKLSLMML